MTGFAWTPVCIHRMIGLRQPLIKTLNRFSEISPYYCNIAQACRSAEDEMGLWLKCHNPDGSRNDNPWLTNCNGYPLGVVAPNGIQGTGESNHQGGYAVDLAIVIGGEYNKVLENYHTIAAYMQQAAKEVNAYIVYGGTWPKPKTDSDHWELDRTFYPNDSA